MVNLAATAAIVMTSALLTLFLLAPSLSMFMLLERPTSQSRLEILQLLLLIPLCAFSCLLGSFSPPSTDH